MRRFARYTSSLALALALALVAIPCSAASKSAKSTPRRVAVEIHLALAQSHFLMKELMALRVVIRNDAASSVDLPNPEDNRNTQPVYTVTGPSFPHGRDFNLRELVMHDPNPAKVVEDGMVLSLPAGAAREVSLPIETLLDFTKPGLHGLSAAIVVSGQLIRSNWVEFEIEAPVIESLQSVLDDGSQTTHPIPVLCLHRGARGSTLYQAIFNEDRPDLGEISLLSLVRQGAADANAVAVVATSANHARMARVHSRFGWRAGDVIAMTGIPGLPSSQEVRLTRPHSAARLVRPAMLTESGDVDVMALEGGSGATLWLMRLPPAGQGLPGVVATIQLPGEALSARAALAPASVGETRTAVVIHRGPHDGARISLVQIAPGDNKPKVRTVAIAHANPLPASEPGIHVDVDGTVHTSALFAEDKSLRKLFIASIVWPASGGNGQLERMVAGELPGQPRAAAVTYSVSYQSPARRAWVVLLENGGVVSGGWPKGPRALRGTPSLPLDLVAMSKMSYLLTLDAQGLPRLELVF